MDNIDWSVFDEYDVNDNTCRCGVDFASHTKYVLNRGLISRLDCPGCGHNDHLISSRGRPELFVIKKGE